MNVSEGGTERKGDFGAPVRDVDWKIEADYQMGAKLEAQQALLLIVKALDLNPAELPAGWGNATGPILVRIEAIIDEADRLARERDRAVAALERIEDVTRTARYPDVAS